MSLRWRIIGSFMLLVAVAVGLGTAAHLAEVSRQLEASLSRQTARVALALQTEFQVTRQVLDAELNIVVGGALVERWLSAPNAGRFLLAKGRLQEGRLDVLKVLNDKGQILISGHWPSSFGALDPLAPRYRSDGRGGFPILTETTPSGRAATIERWTRVTRGRTAATVVAGRFLDQSALSRLRTTVGADVLALCEKLHQTSSEQYEGGSILDDDESVGRCVHATSEDTLSNVEFHPSARAWRGRYALTQVSLEGTEDYVVVTGLLRDDVDAIRGGIVRRALAVGLASVLLAMLLGLLLATRITRPIEALAQAAAEVADGNLEVRVDAGSQGGGSEVRRLVDSFHQMAEDIATSQRELRRAERVAAWREIARGLAHELKNPLTPIRGAMDVIRRAYALGREDFEAIMNEQAEAVVEEVQRLKELSDTFARFARLPEPNPEPLLVGSVFDKAAALYATGAIDVERDVPDTLTAFADRTQLHTAVTNLIKNAVEAMDHEGTLYLRARAVMHDEVGGTELVIEDSGAGISEDIKERLFTPYFTTKGSRGTGLGLALVHRIVVEHGGTIQVDNGDRGGARFTLWLPAESRAVNPAPEVLADPPENT